MIWKLLIIAIANFLIRGFCWSLPVLPKIWLKHAYPNGMCENNGMKLKHFIVSIGASIITTILAGLIIFTFQTNILIISITSFLILLVYFFNILEMVFYGNRSFIALSIEYLFFSIGFLFSLSMCYIIF